MKIGFIGDYRYRQIWKKPYRSYTDMKSFSNEDIHLAHFGLPVWLPESLTDHQITIIFQPTAWASPARTKTNWLSDDRLEMEEFFFFHQMCAIWLSSLENDFI